MADLLTIPSLAAKIGFSLVLGNGPSNDVVVAVGEMAKFTAVTNGKMITAVWEGHPIAGDSFCAKAELTQCDGVIEWGFSYSGQSSTCDVVSVSFPVVVRERTDETRILYPPALGPGRIFRPQWAKAKPDEKVQESRLGVPSFQFTALLTPGERSFYLDTRDTSNCARQFIYANGWEPGTIELSHLVPVPLDEKSRKAWRIPYRGTMRLFYGGWYEAASIYRPWARKQRWYLNALGRPHAPLENIAIWFWNRGRADSVLPVVERFQEMSGVPVALDWYWWHAIPYDMCYPNYWPPRDGEEIFAQACRRLAEKGIFAQVYMNGQSWDMDDPSWKEGGVEEVKMNRDGSWRAIAFNCYSGHRLSYVCGEAPRFQAKIRSHVCKLRKAGLPSVYLDEISCTAQGVCYNPRHSHVPGDPHAMVPGYRKYLADVRRENPGILLSSEEFSEAYMDVFDSLITLFGCYERFAGAGAPMIEEVPVVPALYHGAVAMFGAYTMVDGIPPWDPKWPPEGKWDKEEFWPAKFPDQFAVEFGRSVVWGMQPTVHHFRYGLYDDERYSGSVRLMVDTARFYHANRDVLYHGEMLAPGKMRCETDAVDFMVRKTYAKKGVYDVVNQPALPTVMHSVWRNAKGEKSVVLYNWSRAERSFALTTEGVTIEGTIPPRSWRRMSIDK